MSTIREEEIFNAIENGTYRFALQQCQKLIKKSPKSTYYQVLNSYILLESGREEEALQNSLDIMSRTPNDIKSLLFLNKIFNKLNRPKEAQQVYENAARKYPSFELLTNWFHLGCETGDYRTLQKSSIALKNFQSSQRLFHLWAAFNSYLGSINEDANKMEKTLFPKLGLKIAEDLKPMTREQEVFVLVKLLELNGKLVNVTEEIIKFTGDDKLDLELQIILLDTLNKLEDWEVLYHYSEHILVQYKLDDFNSWKYLIKSGLKMNRSEDVLKVINDYNNSRNSQLALVEFNLQSGIPIEEPVFKYLTNLGAKNSAFLDIKNYLPHIDSSKLLSWLQEQPIPEDTKGLFWTVNSTKFKAFLQKDTIFSRPEFVKENISNFNKYQPLISKKIKTDFFPGDEFLFFIIDSLFTQEFSRKNIILAIIILENAVLGDVHEFHLRLWLMQLYTLINAHSQARVHYDALKVKQIQHDIFDHYLISRVASISPNYGNFLDMVTNNYKRIETESVYYTKVGFNKAAFNKLKGILEFQERISRSSLKEHVVLQGLKIGRLLNDKSIIETYTKANEDLPANDKKYDNRDFKIFWDIGISEELSFKSKILANIPEDLQEYNKIQRFLERLINGSSETSHDFNLSTLSEIEKWSFELILQVVKFVNDKDGQLTELKSLYSSVPKIPIEINWEVSHTIVNIIETTKSVQSLISKAFKSITGSKKSDLNELKELNVQVLSSIRDGVLDKRQELNRNIDSLQKEIKGNSLLKDLNIPNSTTERVIEIIRNSNDESFKVLRIL